MTNMTRAGTFGAALLLSVAAMAGETSGPVSVEFVNPGEFADIKERMFPSKPEENRHLQSLRKHMEKSAARYLSSGQTLLIKFVDIDLAGEILPQTNPSFLDVRTVKGVYPPRAKLSYELRDAQGAAIRSGDADLRDLGFDTQAVGAGSDPLRFEKRMLDKWLRKEFGNSAR